MEFLGKAFVELAPEDAGDEEAVLEAIVKGRTEVGGRGATLGESFRKMFISGVRWSKRGGQRV
jgi:hypothetical protein